MLKDIYKNVCQESVFKSLFDLYAKDLHDFVYYKYGSVFDPSDKVQEAFLKLWENCNKVSSTKAKSFLFTIVNNLTLNQIKHQKVKLKYQADQPKPTDHQNPQFLLEEKEYLAKYQNALANISEAQRVAFLMNRIEGKKHQEIADILGISRKAVEKRIYNALENLRKHIEDIP